MDKHPFPYNIRHKLSFFRDTFDIIIQNAHTLTVSWEISEETMRLAEAVLFEKTQDMIKELRIVIKRKDIELSGQNAQRMIKANGRLDRRLVMLYIGLNTEL